MASGHPSPAFAATVLGLGPILAAEAGTLDLRPGATESDGRADLIPFGRTDWGAIGALRTAEDVFIQIAQLRLAETARATARQLGIEQVAEGVSALAAVEGRRARRLRLVVRLRQERRFTCTQLREALVRRLDDQVAEAGDRAAAELWVISTSKSALRVGLRVRTLGTRSRQPRRVERPGAVRPAVAAGMVRLLPRQGIVLDPCCGTGTIAIEAASVGFLAVAGDLDPAAVAVARANGAAVVLRLDARRLPLAADGVDAVVTNLPFGRQHRVQGSPIAWYRRALQEALRVAPDLVVLAAPTLPFRQALGRLDVRLKARYDLTLLGNRTTIWVLQRC